MTQTQQLQDDLQFIRRAVVRRERFQRGPTSIFVLWGMYVFIGYALFDFAQAWAGPFLLVGGITGGIASAAIGKRADRRSGVSDHAQDARAGLHFGIGIILAVASATGLAFTIPALRGPAAGQVCVAMIGLIYFVGGIYYEKRYLVLGPVLIVGGILVGLLPKYGWTTLGAIVALGLIVPSLVRSHNVTAATSEGPR